MDTAFEEVIWKCADAKRADHDGTWITDEMLNAYVRLHALGLAHSVEAYQEGKLVGGLYGVSLGTAFFGESMFASVNDASKVAFVTLVERLQEWGMNLIDCQVHTDHLERFGAVLWKRSRFLNALEKAMDEPTRQGKWQFK